MNLVRSFREVKLQWLQQLSCDKELSDSARSVALYIVTTHLNGHTEKAWPSYQTIANSTGKSVKTVQRAIRELETTGWFEIRRGNGIGHNTEYRPSAPSILRASDARQKTDQIVTLSPEKGGHVRPSRPSNMSCEGGHICPPNPEKEKIYKPNARADTLPRGGTRRAIPLVFVADTKVKQVEQWRSWFGRHDLPSIDDLGFRTARMGKSGYVFPSHWPPNDHEPATYDLIGIFNRRDWRPKCNSVG